MKDISALTSTIVLGDARELIRELPPESVDAIITDPPYGADLAGEAAKWDKWPPASFWHDCHRVVKPNGFLVFTITPHLAHERLRDLIFGNWRVLETGVWIYGNGRPVNKHRLKHSFDLVYFCAKDPGATRLFTDQARGAHPTGSVSNKKAGNAFTSMSMGKQYRTQRRKGAYTYGNDAHPANVMCEVGTQAFGDTGYELIFAIKRMRGKGRHPTEKPVDLMAQLIKLTTQKGDVVLDSFCGHGSTLMAAAELERKWIGFEREEIYASQAQQKAERELGTLFLHHKDIIYR